MTNLDIAVFVQWKLAKHYILVGLFETEDAAIEFVRGDKGTSSLPHLIVKILKGNA